MTNNTDKKSGGLICKGIRDLYTKLTSLEKPYLKTKGYLFYIDDIGLSIGETEYSFDGMFNIDIPYHIETLTVKLKRLEYNTVISEECRIKSNTMNDYDHDADLYMQFYDLNIPEEQELESAKFKDRLPVTYIKKDPVHIKQIKKGLFRNDQQIFISYLKEYLEKNGIQYKHDKDGNTPRITMVFDAPEKTDKILTGTILFYENHADYRLVYTDTRKFMPKEPPHPDRLQRLMNYINENVFVEQEEFGHKDRKHVYYTPRIYVNYGDNLTITAKTMIDYNIWRRIPETYDYIVKDCPAMLFSITYLIAAVYAGVISSKLAIEEIDSWNT